MSRLKPTYGSQWRRGTESEKREWQERNPILPVGFRIENASEGWFGIHYTPPDIPRLDTGVPTYVTLDRLMDLRKCITEFLNKVEEESE